MVRMAALLLDDAAVAEDVVQEASSPLHRNGANLRDPAAALGYVRMAVVNRTRSTIRHRQVVRRHLAQLQDVPSVGGADEPVLVAEEQQRTYDAVRRLPRRQQEVLILRYWLRLSEAEIAAALSISAGTVKLLRSAAASPRCSRPGETHHEQRPRHGAAPERRPWTPRPSNCLLAGHPAPVRPRSPNRHGVPAAPPPPGPGSAPD